MEIRQRLKSREGFSLAEMLLTVLIMLLVSLLMANGIPTVKAIYERVTVGANARVMLTTTIAALRNELGTAKDVEYADEKDKHRAIKYHSTDTQSTAKIYLENPELDNSPIMLQEYAYADTDIIKLGENNTTENNTTENNTTENNTTENKPLWMARRLVTHASATGRFYVAEGLYATYDEVTISGSVVTFSKLTIRRQKGDTGVETPVQPVDVSIRLTFAPKT